MNGVLRGVTMVPSAWGQVRTGGPTMASAALDRLLHRSTVINIRGESYRLKEKRQARAASTKEVPQNPAPSI